MITPLPATIAACGACSIVCIIQFDMCEHDMRSTDSNKDRTAADRKRRERQRLREAGFVPMEVWVRPELRERVKRYVERLMRRPS